jgi:hypothetical protein
MNDKPKEPKTVKSPALQADEPSATFAPKPVEEPVDRSEIRRRLMARFPKTLAFLAK